jgi:hypothetical protein
MLMFSGVVAVDVVVAGSALVALAVVPRVVAGGTEIAPVSRRRAGPGVALGVVVALIYLNQVLVTVYVSRVHGGDVSFIAPYLPSGWFAMATDNSALEAIARRFPAPELLAPTVLRVQAFLELPFVLFAYLTVLRWLDRGWYTRLARSPLVWAAALAYTFVFCAVEWELRNPYTTDDIIVRIVAAVATPPLVIWLARREGGEQPPISALGLAAFAVSAWALGYLILFVYDTALLYNLAHVRDRLYGAATALAVLPAARLIAGRRPTGGGAAVSAIALGLRWSLGLFFVPALAVRYGVNFGTPIVAAATGCVIVLAAAWYVARDALLPVHSGRRFRLLVQLAGAAVAGLAVAYAAVRWYRDTFYEGTLLRGVVGFLITAIIVCALTDKTSRIIRGTRCYGVPKLFRSADSGMR